MASTGRSPRRAARPTGRLGQLKLASLALLGLPLASATQFYIDCSQTQSGNGSSTASPWNSYKEANNHTFLPGDILSLMANVTCTGTLAPLGSGNRTAPIRLQFYPQDSIAGPPIVNGGGAAAALTLTNQDYWRVSHLKVMNPAAALGRRQGILVSATDGGVHFNITIDHNTVTDVAGETNKATNSSAFSASAGIAFAASNGSSFDGVAILDNTVTDCGGGGIKVHTGVGSVYGANARVAFNTIDGCGGDGIVVENSMEPLIDYNVASNLGAGKYPWTGGNFAGIWVLSAHNPVMRHNVVWGSVMSLYDSEAFDCDWGITGTCLVEYNYSHDNAGGAFLNCDGCGTSGAPKQIVRYNVFENDCRMISVGENPEMWFYNNIMYCPDTEFNLNVPPTTHFINNIFVGMPNATLPTGSGISWESNLFTTVVPPTENGLTGDPAFLSPGNAGKTLGSVFGYRLKTGSPALSSGAVVDDNGGIDFFGLSLAAYTSPNVGVYNGAGQ